MNCLNMAALTVESAVVAERTVVAVVSSVPVEVAPYPYPYQGRTVLAPVRLVLTSKSRLGMQ